MRDICQIHYARAKSLLSRIALMVESLKEMQRVSSVCCGFCNLKEMLLNICEGYFYSEPSTVRPACFYDVLSVLTTPAKQLEERGI